MSRLLSDITPSPVLFLPAKMSVLEAAELMSKARTDAGLVESEEGRLVGILTDSDVSIKVVASGLSLRKTTVEEVMTKNPLCVRECERADRALALMVEKRARHLPLLEAEGGGLSGMLDIAKVLYDAISRLEKSKDASDNLYFPAMNRLAGTGGSGDVIPTLAEALEGRPGPAFAQPGDPIEVAFEGLRRTRRSVLVVDAAGKLVGILSKSDVAKRALRNALQATEDDLKALHRLRVKDVMTPRPDFVTSNNTVLCALHKMHDGKYSNMPILDVDFLPVGVVDVLDLLRATISSPAKKIMPSLLEGFFAAPKEEEEKQQTLLSDLRPEDADEEARGAESRTASTEDDDDDSSSSVQVVAATPAKTRTSTIDEDEHKHVPIATAVEMFPPSPSKASKCHNVISPSTLKHSIGISSTIARDFSFELSLPKNQILVAAGDSTYELLTTLTLDRLAPLRVLEVAFDYSDYLAKLRVVNNDTLRAACQLRLSLDPAANAVPLSVVVVKRKPDFAKVFLKLAGVASVAALCAFAAARAPSSK